MVEHGFRSQTQEFSGSISGLQICVILSVAIMSSLMSSLLPVLLGNLMQEGRLTTQQIGQAATIELLAMGLASAVAGARLPPRRIRLVGVGAGMMMVVANILTIFASHAGILLARGVSGIGCGLLVWVLVNFFIRSERPSKWVGLYLILQSVVSLAFVSLFSAVLIPRFGINGCFAALAVLSTGIAALSLLLPKAFSAIGGGLHSIRMPPPRGVIALVVALFYSAGVLAAWAYAEALLRERGIGGFWIGRAFALGFVMQILGAGLASLIGYRLSPRWIIVGASLGGGVAGFAMLNADTTALALIAVAIFSFLWMLAVPQITPFVLASDPSKTAALQTGSAQAIGYAVGPALASTWVRTGDVGPAIWVAAGCFAIALAAIAALCLMRMPEQQNLQC
jgi:hypothetical protein